MLIRVDGEGPKVDPPLRVRVEAGSAAGEGLAARIEQAIRAKLIVQARVELVPRGVLPRTEMKAKLVERNIS